jgi:hypothetical protein
LLVLLRYQDVEKKNFDWAINGRNTIVLLNLRLGGIEFSFV